MAVACLNDTILVRHAAVVACDEHAVMRTKYFVAFCLIFRGITVKIAERC